MAPGRSLLGAPALALALVFGCGRSPPDATPDGAVREFVERLRTYEGAEADANTLFALLSSRSRDNLVSRAERYGAATGKTIAPAAMIVPARLQLGFEPRSYSARTNGDVAQVEVVGPRPEDVAKLSCVLENERWRVDINLPELPPMRTRTTDSR